jgi:hypothetical protein
MTPYKHAESSAQKWGGTPESYVEIHNWFDETKQYTGDWTHRSLRHHAAGIQWCIEKFGHSWPVLCNDKKTGESKVIRVPVKMIAEQHVMEDCGFIPTVQDWLKILAKHPEQWMLKVGTKTLTHPMKIL